MDTGSPWQVRRQLDGLIDRLTEIVDRDPEQEVRGIALPVLDAVIANAKAVIGPADPVVQAAVDVVSPETISAGEPVRAVDALLFAQMLRDTLKVPSIKTVVNDPWR